MSLKRPLVDLQGFVCFLQLVLVYSSMPLKCVTPGLAYAFRVHKQAVTLAFLITKNPYEKAGNPSELPGRRDFSVKAGRVWSSTILRVSPLSRTDLQRGNVSLSQPCCASPTTLKSCEIFYFGPKFCLWQPMLYNEDLDSMSMGFDPGDLGLPWRRAVGLRHCRLQSLKYLLSGPWQKTEYTHLCSAMWRREKKKKTSYTLRSCGNLVEDN